MNNNRAFWKALYSLTHPLSILSILLLLLNDHWLRHTYPSWLTGKLGDFTWLLFAPFITAMLFALIIPKTVKNHTTVVGLISIGFIGIWFATAKTIPAVHWLTTETLYAIVGYRGSLRMDVTDLWTLPALLFSWHIWRQSAETSINLKPVGYVAFGLGIVVTLANSPAPPEPLNFGVWSYIRTVCELNDERLLIPSNYEGFLNNSALPSLISVDGGFRWQNYDYTITTENCSSLDDFIAIDPNDNNIQYHWVRNQYVEKSTDAGETWYRINDLIELRQDIREYGNQNPLIGWEYTQAQMLALPLSGIVHSATGNLVLSMGRVGMLIIEPDETSHWVGIEDARLDDLQDGTLINNALAVHRLILPTLWFLILVTTVTLIHSKMVLEYLWLALGWVSWIYLLLTSHRISEIAIILEPESYRAFNWNLFALASLCFIAIPMVSSACYRLGKYYKQAAKYILITAFLASLAYLLPLLLWTQGTIPRYYMAAIFSILLVACVLWACYQQFKDKLPAKHQPEKAKRKQKES